jgi:hypothetical protein
MQQQQQQQINLDIKQAEDVPCEKCGNLYFSPIVMLKKFSPLISPTGQELNVPIQVFQCTSCSDVHVPFSE